MAKPENDEDRKEEARLITKPLSETEAKEFIAKEVERNLKGYIKAFWKIAGVAGLVGLFGVFAAVYQAATNEAREVTKMITGGTEAKFQDLLISYGNLASKREVMEAELTRTREDLEKFRNTDPAKISQIVASLNTEGHSVLEKVTQILNKKVYEYRITTSGFTLVYNPPANNTEYLVGDFPGSENASLGP